MKFSGTETELLALLGKTPGSVVAEPEKKVHDYKNMVTVPCNHRAPGSIGNLVCTMPAGHDQYDIPHCASGCVGSNGNLAVW